MNGLPLLLMLPGALLYFGSKFIAELMESARSQRENHRQQAETFGVPLEPPPLDQAEADELQKDQYRVLAKVVGAVIFNIGVVTIFL